MAEPRTNEPERPVFDEEHGIFRSSIRRFLAEEATPNLPAWHHCGSVPRTTLLACARQGMLAPQVPTTYGGAGGDYRFNAVVVEEVCRAGLSHSTFNVHSDIVADYLLRLGSEAQKQHLLPAMVSGQTLTAICMSEPGAGSDLKAIRTRAIQTPSGWQLSGSKSFITNGASADLFLVAAVTDPNKGVNGISLFLVPGDAPGVARGQRLSKIGMHDQDTCELFFDDVALPPDALLGEQDRGYLAMQAQLPQERLSLAVAAIASAEYAFELTLQHTRDRQLFGQRLIDMQNTRFVMAEIKTELTIARSYVDESLWRHLDGEFSAVDGAMAKLWTTELQGRVMDRCLQLFGGYGYTTESEIANLFTAARAQRIYGGASEVMKEIIGRSIAG